MTNDLSLLIYKQCLVFQISNPVFWVIRKIFKKMSFTDHSLIFSTQKVAGLIHVITHNVAGLIHVIESKEKKCK